MAQLIKSSFVAKYGSSGTEFPDNSNGSVTEATFRQFGQDISDSLLFTTELRSIRVQITSAELLTINSYPITILSPPGANSYYTILQVNAIYDFVSSAYDQQTGELQLEYTGASNVLISLLYSLLEYTEDRIFRTTMVFSSNADESSELLNQGLRLTNTVADPMSGDGNITLDIVYRIVTI